MIKTIELNAKYSTTKKILKADFQYMTELASSHKKLDEKFETIMVLPENKTRKGVGGLRMQECFKVSEHMLANQHCNRSPRSEETMKPLITIITVVFNGERFLKETILSVLNQTYENIEYIIIDGGSTDRTLDIIREYEHAIDYWVSENDKGMYDAINKGLVLAQGDIVNFINSDDYFYNCEVLDSISRSFLLSGAECIYGRSKYVNMSGGEIFEKKPLRYKKRYLKTLGLFFSQPTFFWTRSLMKENGLIDTKYQVCADYDFIAKMLINADSVVRSKILISCFRVFGESFGDKNSKLAAKEFLSINKKYGFKYSKIIGLYDRLVQKIYQYFG
jgi:glycosyltransferase involved in cell wall biosynthesis